MNKKALGIIISASLLFVGCGNKSEIANDTKVNETSTTISSKVDEKASSSSSTNSKENPEPTTTSESVQTVPEITAPDLKPVTIAALVAQKIWPAATSMPIIGYTNDGENYVVNQGESPYSIQFQVKGDQVLILPESKESPNTEYSLAELVNEFYTDPSSIEMTNLLTQQMSQTNYESGQ